jgi:hypothetical protein
MPAPLSEAILRSIKTGRRAGMTQKAKETVGRIMLQPDNRENRGGVQELAESGPEKNST